MSFQPRWLAIAAVFLVLGCNEKAGDSGATGANSSSSSTASGSGSSTTTTGTETGASATVQSGASAGGEVVMPSGLKYQDVVVGTGAEATNGKRVTVRYNGTLTNGTKFDAGDYTFVLGNHEVISGWDQGILGMKVGGKRKLTIPPELGYGGAGSGPIPPNATLLFDTELVDVK